MLPYRTADGRFVALTMLASDRHWPRFCRAIGEPEVAGDPRFADQDARRRNARACVEWLDGVFAGRDLDEWRRALAGFPGSGRRCRRPASCTTTPRCGPTATSPRSTWAATEPLPMVTVPVQFDEQPSRPTRAPEHGEHTESVLVDLGLSWDEIGRSRTAGRVL